MGDTTDIAYAHSTFNGWIGCTAVPGNPQCSKCYAELMAKFRGWAKWGDDQPRMLTSEANWRKPFRWDWEARAAGAQRRVFAFSLGDVFDEYGPIWPKDRRWPMDRMAIDRGDNVPALNVFLYGIVQRTPHLTWMLFTKRYERCAAYLKSIWGNTPWPNVWVIFSAGTQKNLYEATRAHWSFDAVVHGISCEPSFEELDFGAFSPVNWVIGGTESGHHARHTDRLDWFRSTAQQCKQWQVPFYMKQITNAAGRQVPLESWPEDLRVREFPRV